MSARYEGTSNLSSSSSEDDDIFEAHKRLITQAIYRNNQVILKHPSEESDKGKHQGSIPGHIVINRNREAADHNRIRHIPVVGEKGMIGMVSIGDVVRAVAKLKAEPETSSTVSQSLGVCRANFDSAVDSLRGAAKNLKEAASHADLMNNLSAATAFVETCNDAFAERRLNSPVAETTELLGKLVSNCLDLGSALQ
ncbi:hypothetical protein ZIOFF_006452 [Zingiber officinale]|uniref:Pectinesterase inhibitor domain-containing protein n=1 Tax=Zingiber officinale TaxID=94328 RepID=A0A8J5M539_ZINOF|nr:hypothetical protein ZIOFF_006452 [Zingiber officinale]